MTMFLRFSTVMAATIAIANADGFAPAPIFTELTKNSRTEVPPEPYCKDGSDYTPTGCATVEVAEFEMNCPHPYKMTKDKNICVSTSHGESAHVCPKNSYLDGKNCVTEMTEPVDASCKKGVLSKNGCVVRDEPQAFKPEYRDPEYICPKGYDLDDGNCIKETAEDSVYTCGEPGYELVGKKCVSNETAPKICKYGTLSKNQCIDSEVTEPRSICPKGTQKDRKGMCVNSIDKDPIKVCEKGYVLSKFGKKCETRILIQAVFEKKGDETAPFNCPNKLDDDGNCYQMHETDPQDVCDQGFELHKNKCIAMLSTGPEYECPSGYDTSAVGNKAECVKTKIYKPICPKHYKEKNISSSNISSNISSNRYSGSSFGTDGLMNIKDRYNNIINDHDNNDRYMMNDRNNNNNKYMDDNTHTNTHTKTNTHTTNEETICTRVKQIYAARSCPKGGSLKGKECTSVQIIPATPICSEIDFELNNNNQCVRAGYSIPSNDKYYDIKYTCPRGYKLNKKDMICVDYVKSSPLIVCEKGYVLEKNTCIAYHEMQPIPICKYGFTSDGKKQCTNVTYDRPRFRCPMGSKDIGTKCYLDMEMPSPTKQF